MSKIHYILLLALLIALIALFAQPGSAVRIIPKEEAYYDCYDWSIKYNKENPEWGIVTMSDNRLFKGTSHMVNYRLANNGLRIHDGLYGIDYTIDDYRVAKKYFRFWRADEVPVRHYKFLRANAPQETQI